MSTECKEEVQGDQIRSNQDYRQACRPPVHLHTSCCISPGNPSAAKSLISSGIVHDEPFEARTRIGERVDTRLADLQGLLKSLTKHTRP